MLITFALPNKKKFFIYRVSFQKQAFIFFIDVNNLKK